MPEELIELDDPTLLRTEGLWAGCWQAAATGRTFVVENPATGAVIARVANMGAQETE
ncbi:MAG: succinate-semialdehyde dehydrogenase (NADP(+)), partial [Synechococcaceae bacterium WB9_2_170]|nr:succinate-semialdehyde dehydrogenase (NADP(+)) [Synechococcaceae bacterium WB9_2_170]